MQPKRITLPQRQQTRQIVESDGVDRAGAGQHQRGAALAGGELPLQRRHIHSFRLRQAGDGRQRVAADAEHAERLYAAGVRIGRQHPDGPQRRQPRWATSTPCCWPSHCRPMASPAKLAMVAPLTRLPLNASGRPSRDFNCVTAASSIAAAIVSWLSWLFWSVTLTSQSAATAAGVPPPVTKPK